MPPLEKQCNEIYNVCNSSKDTREAMEGQTELTSLVMRKGLCIASLLVLIH